MKTAVYEILYMPVNMSSNFEWKEIEKRIFTNTFMVVRSLMGLLYVSIKPEEHAVGSRLERNFRCTLYTSIQVANIWNLLISHELVLGCTDIILSKFGTQT